MNEQASHMITKATADDAEALAKLIDIAGDGIPSWLWHQSAKTGQSPLAVGIERAQRQSGGFSYKNALVARLGSQVAGMILSYPIDQAPNEDPDLLPAPIAPFVALEKHSADTWYINALAVFPGFRGNGIGSGLLHAAERYAHEAGLRCMSIQVYSQNFGAVRLYERLGYTKTAYERVREHPCQPYYSGDVLLLLKSMG